VEVDYTVPPAQARGAWLPPRLAGGGIVQQTLWDVRVPWNQAVVGVPSGWSDENDWHWDVYVWKRRPWMSHAALAAWVGAPAAQGSGSGVAEPGGEGHGYLFGRPGGPEPLPVTVAPRALLVAVCSGLVLMAGAFLVLGRRPVPGLAWVAAMGLGLSVAALVHPALTFQALQSGEVGLLLAALVALLHRLVGGRRDGAGVYGDPSGRNAGLVPGSTLSRTPGVGSDDSTAIRVRPVSTMDYVVTAAPPPPVEGAAPGSSRSEAAARGGAGP
jgi:hypothetical protein